MAIGILFCLILITPIRAAIQRLPPVSLNEESSIGTSIYDINRIYSSLHQYKFAFLSESSPHNSFFIVDSLTGRISIKRMIDREELCRTHICNCDRCILTLEIVASAKDTVDILSLDITIENINDNEPTFPVSSFAIRISESTDVGYVASFPAATDQDFILQQQSLTYRCVPFDEQNDKDLLETFEIVDLHTENQLGLRVLRSLDRETRNLYRMKIVASDGERTGQLFLNVHVLDSNDNVPKFEHDQYHIKLRENVPIGTDILHIHAYDNDEGLNALINYTIVTTSSVNSSSIFPFAINVSSGIIKLIQSLDYERETNFRFNVRARDNGPDAVSVYTQIRIDVLDVNDCPPDIDFILPDADPSRIDPRKHVFYVEEEQPIQTRLFHLSVSDKDSINDKIILTLLSHTDLFQLIEQYNDLYSLSIIGRLDREQQPEYRLTFEARDQGTGPSLTTQKRITIVLIDINDCAPVVDPFPIPISILENNPPNVRLAQFHAQDLDAPNTSNSLLSYSLVPSNESRFFQLDPVSGLLAVGKNVSFDYEQQSLYRLTLNVSDHGIYPSRLETLQSFIVYINDTNDMPPVFEQKSYAFELLENVSIGTFFGRVKAIDGDLTGIIRYELTCIDDQDVFQIDSQSGEMRTKALLDYETHPIHRLVVTAKDDGDLHSDRATVTIELIDINDNPPIIDTPPAVYISSELLLTNSSMSSSVLITTIIATDRDSGQNGNLTFMIEDGNQNEYFSICPSNGTITARSDNLPQGHHRLTIRVCDQARQLDQRRCSLTPLNIKVGEHVEKLFYTMAAQHQNPKKKDLSEQETILTREMILVVIISSILTLLFSITMGILLAVFCKQKRCGHHNRSSSKSACELLQSTDADKLLSTTNGNNSRKLNGHHHLETYDEAKAPGGGISSEDSCYGSNDLSRSSSSAHGVARPLLNSTHRSSSLSSTSVDYAVPAQRQQQSYNGKPATVVVVGIHQTAGDNAEDSTHHLKTFHSPGGHYNLKKTVQSLTRRPVAELQSTYLTYDSVDLPPPPTSTFAAHSSTPSSSVASCTSREYSI